MPTTIFSLATIGLASISLLSGAAPPAGLQARVDNPWFPLVPGTRLAYEGIKDGKPSRDVVTVMHRTELVDGVPCTVVEDRLVVAGHLAERTTDWYAQDAGGNVWYLGEDTAVLDADGRVTSREGSWRSGVDGARAGILMPAHPRPGQSGQQELLVGHAEDRFRVLARLGPNALLVAEWTPLEP